MKTTFVDGNPAIGLEGTPVNAAFLNPLNNHRHMGLAQDADGAIDYAPDTGAANAYVVALAPALPQYVVGLPVYFLATNANTGASTLNVNGLGVKTIKKRGAQDLEAGDILAGQMVCVVYDGTNLQLITRAFSQDTRRNAVINGAMKVAQRAVPNLSTASQYGKVDRFRVHATGTAVSAGTITQGAAVALGQEGYTLHVAGATITGTGIIYKKTRLEAMDSLRFKNRSMVVSLLALHDVGANVNYTITVRKANAADDFSAVTDILAGAAAAVVSGAVTKLTLPVPNMGDCSNGIEIELKIECGAVTAKNFHTTEWQAEEGLLSTAFERTSFTSVVTLCQRYFEKSFPLNTTPAQITTMYQYLNLHGGNGGIADGCSLWSVPFKVSKIKIPTVLCYTATTTGSFVCTYLRNDASGYVGVGGLEPYQDSFKFIGSYAGSGNVATTRSISFNWIADADL